ncbi:MAG: hypothetical protein C5B46_00225 [Proteobacteria bacterium]|nr:MAG: hypothetical protein C5B46_00225 [Pseudomonadota bacterium]
MALLRGAAAIGLLLSAWLAASPALGQDVAPVPELKAHVTDLTATLTSTQLSALDQKLAAFEQRKGSQIAVLIVPTTQPEPIEAYSIRVADQWKLGRKKIDDGVILVVAKNDRRLRIEVGYGLEGVLSDAVSNRIIDEIITPKFRANDFYGGIDAGADAIIKLVDGEPLPEPAWSHRPQARSGWQNYIVFLLFGVFIVGGALRAMLGRLPAALVVGGGAAVVVWIIATSVFAAAIAAIIAFVITLVGGSALPLGGRGIGGGWGGGGFGGGGFGGGGGGFSGGGGGFGGGGASGRW